MRLAMLTYSTKPRGGVVHASNLAEALARLGVEVEIFSLSKEDKPRFYRPLSVPCTIFRYRPREGIVANVKGMIETYVKNLPTDFDIYHTQDCIGAVALSRLKKSGKIGAPTFRTVHHVDIFDEYRLKEFQESSIHDCDYKLVVSKYWQRHLLGNYGISSYIIHNGVDVKRFNVSGNKIREQYRIKGPLVLFVGGLEPRKGLEYLIFAMEKVLREFPAVKLIAIGKRGLKQIDHESLFRLLVERLGLSKSTILLEEVDEKILPRYYAACDIYVLPSRMEGWGIGLMEAMASGKPVIGTKAGGVPELVKDSVNGILVEPGDIDGLAEAILRLLKDKKLRKRLGAAGLTTARQYKWSDSAKKAKMLYEMALRDAR